MEFLKNSINRSSGMYGEDQTITEGRYSASVICPGSVESGVVGEDAFDLSPEQSHSDSHVHIRPCNPMYLASTGGGTEVFDPKMPLSPVSIVCRS